ncbi:MAG TPA: FMN-binding negative transcriptional regulator [Pseudomonas sp.]|jgi:transcriptional regulator
MYMPAAFKDDDIASLHELMEHARLAILVTHDGGEMQASHLPLLLDPEQGAYGTLYGHLAKANPQSQALANGAQVMVIFPGADAYVSPSFYAAKAEHGKVVPTWNYVAVHAYAIPEAFVDAERLLKVVSGLTDKHEAGRASPWAVNDAPADYIEKMLGAIVGFALPIDRLEGKRKLSQNRSAADIKGVHDGLTGSADVKDQELARLMS